MRAAPDADDYAGLAARLEGADPECFAHPYGCRCRQCTDMAKAICAQGPDGEYVFSDDELTRIAASRNEPAPEPEGEKPCERCRGRGIIHSAPDVVVTCPDCGGLGVVKQ